MASNLVSSYTKKNRDRNLVMDVYTRKTKTRNNSEKRGMRLWVKTGKTAAFLHKLMGK